MASSMWLTDKREGIACTVWQVSLPAHQQDLHRPTICGHGQFCKALCSALRIPTSHTALSAQASRFLKEKEGDSNSEVTLSSMQILGDITLENMDFGHCQLSLFLYTDCLSYSRRKLSYSLPSCLKLLALITLLLLSHPSALPDGCALFPS